MAVLVCVCALRLGTAAMYHFHDGPPLRAPPVSCPLYSLLQHAHICFTPCNEALSQ